MFDVLKPAVYDGERNKMAHNSHWPFLGSLTERIQREEKIHFVHASHKAVVVLYESRTWDVDVLLGGLTPPPCSGQVIHADEA